MAGTLCKIGVRTDDPALPVAGTGKLSAVRKSKRSKWRAGVLIGVHALIALHVTHFAVTRRTLSPVEPSESMYTLELGYVNAGFIFFAVILLGTLVFGRFFCGWGCHIVALQDLCGWLMKRLGVRPRPFRSRFLAFAPLLVAFYMFAWPTLKRLAVGPDRSFPGLSNHLMTSDLWATFPGPLFTVLTFVTCGFAAVYFLGAKGFCTYGCPYGAMFGALDYASPGRIVVSDACEQCGHCTATCTSNVRVHEEVRLYGMVVDPGCMKCMDCVSVCPKGALSFSFAMPSLFKKGKAGSAPRAKRYDLSLSEELFVALLALVSTLVFRDLYNGPPLLLSVGLGGITAFLALKLWHLAKRPGVRVQNLELKSAGRLRRPGWVFATLTVLWLVFTSHSAFAQWHRAWGRHYLNRTEASRADVLSGDFRGKHYSSGHTQAAAEAFHHFSLADRWGLAGVVEVKLGLAWCHLLQNDFRGAAAKAEEAMALAPEQPELRQNLLDVQRAEVAAAVPPVPAAGARFELATRLAASGNLEEAAREFGAYVAELPEDAPARYNFGGVLRRLGRNDAAIEQLEIARQLMPEDADVCIELGLAYQAIGAKDEAVEAFQRAITLNPESPESKFHLPGLIRELEGSIGPGSRL
jgi:tetratricopeptide (TPR) repeat protein/ferredoxin